MLTINFLHMWTARDGVAGVEVRDGPSSNSVLLLKFTVNNHTLPMSVSSTRSSIWLKLTVQRDSSAAVYMDIVPGKSKSQERGAFMVIFSSLLVEHGIIDDIFKRLLSPATAAAAL